MSSSTSSSGKKERSNEECSSNSNKKAKLVVSSGAGAGSGGGECMDLIPDDNTLNKIAENLVMSKDFADVLPMATANAQFKSVIQKWECAKCTDAIFVVPVAAGQQKLSLRDGTKPFVCGGCKKKHCGQDQHGCRMPHFCPGCKNDECRDCMVEHLEDCEICELLSHTGGRYCRECQGACEVCNVCGDSSCQHHQTKCDKCGIEMCGILSFLGGMCDFCERSFCLCPGCRDLREESLFECRICLKTSCFTAACRKKLIFDGFDGGSPICKKCLARAGRT